MRWVIRATSIEHEPWTSRSRCDETTFCVSVETICELLEWVSEPVGVQLPIMQPPGCKQRTKRVRLHFRQVTPDWGTDGTICFHK